ncbi:uncharacterized protein LOC119315842 [Triticum dicoccoides]|uniref:uncharacterized protein LOC119315842 n=1 Tax=Triticum dicoccoides TaxID=85692 RepID=UPI001891833F|nr:uncharacterized protein LOC119315842 [Triticum dicoccoides]
MSLPRPELPPPAFEHVTILTVLSGAEHTHQLLLLCTAASSSPTPNSGRRLARRRRCSRPPCGLSYGPLDADEQELLPAPRCLVAAPTVDPEPLPSPATEATTRPTPCSLPCSSSLHFSLPWLPLPLIHPLSSLYRCSPRHGSHRRPPPRPAPPWTSAAVERHGFHFKLLCRPELLETSRIRALPRLQPVRVASPRPPLPPWTRLAPEQHHCLVPSPLQPWAPQARACLAALATSSSPSRLNRPRRRREPQAAAAALNHRLHARLGFLSSSAKPERRGPPLLLIRCRSYRARRPLPAGLPIVPSTAYSRRRPQATAAAMAL